ncbi:unnamed protein product [Adineta ricciae]|uniref:Apple domain-containing protein n=1 Tax=Adineta ricciae TaxID=249248 RepID=A0A813U381_ADIRI|nr:unnamed protein product [Adineta ricciae]CAF1149058.1 unnamed protein product [Adineta ricciae]
MSIVNQSQFRCATTTCSPYAIVTVSNIRQCQMNCLGQAQCKAASFRQMNSSCQLFDNSINQNKSLKVTVETTTMIVIYGTRAPPEPITTSTTTSSTTTTTTTTVDSRYIPSASTCSITAATLCTTTTPMVATCQSYEVSWNNNCYHLDGSAGNCAAGYTLATNAILDCISSLFIGKNYRNTISDNCCITTADTYQCYGFNITCNIAGPFVDAPSIGGDSCFNALQSNPRQLTLCRSI